MNVEERILGKWNIKSKEPFKINKLWNVSSLINNVFTTKVKTNIKQKTIDELKEAEGSKLSSKNASLKKEEESNFNSLNVLEMEIRKLDIDIEDLEKKIEDKKKVYEREEKDKDEAINNQSLLFQEMTVRFQHILENTANKLQERVKTGN